VVIKGDLIVTTRAAPFLLMINRNRRCNRSPDGTSMVVANTGPRDPGSFWLVKDGRLSMLGSRNPLVNPDQLADVKYNCYNARDRMAIPGYVTIPKGKPPFPLIAQHNGGPAVNGMADPDLVAFFGWSYGGYAALVSLSREAQLYHCAITVAALADAETQYLGRRQPYLKAFDDRNRHRGGTTVNPINEVAKVNIPLLMVHGDVDLYVMYYHLKDHQKAFQAAVKTGEFITMQGADHFYITLMYNHQPQL